MPENEGFVIFLPAVDLADVVHADTAHGGEARWVGRAREEGLLADTAGTWRQGGEAGGGFGIAGRARVGGAGRGGGGAADDPAAEGEGGGYCAGDEEGFLFLGGGGGRGVGEVPDAPFAFGGEDGDGFAGEDPGGGDESIVVGDGFGGVVSRWIEGQSPGAAGRGCGCAGVEDSDCAVCFGEEDAGVAGFVGVR